MSDGDKQKCSNNTQPVSDFKTINISRSTKEDIEAIRKITGQKLFVICEDALKHYIEEFYPKLKRKA